MGKNKSHVMFSSRVSADKPVIKLMNQLARREDRDVKDAVRRHLVRTLTAELETAD